jgi:hypothetical protein
MDRVASLLEASNDIIVGVRFVEDEGMTLDIYTPDMVTIIPNKLKPTKALGIAYESAMFMQGRFHPTWVVWDDEVWFVVDQRGIPIQDITQHALGRKPFSEFHRNAPWQTYWDSCRGNDIESAQLRIGVLAAQMLSVIKDQGHLQLAWVGPTNSNPKPMQVGTASVLRFDNLQGTGDVKVLNLQAQITQYIEAIREEESMVGAAHGFSRERLNLSTDIHGSNEALQEQTEQLMQRMSKGEKDLFELYKIISLQHPGLQLESETKLAIDYGPLYHRTDRKTQLELRKEEIAQGVRSPIDSVREDNPEIETDDEARVEFERNISDMAELLRMRMEHNLATDANMVDQGQDARANGALGPAVRDGKIPPPKAKANPRDVVRRALGL